MRSVLICLFVFASYVISDTTTVHNSAELTNALQNSSVTIIELVPQTYTLSETFSIANRQSHLTIRANSSTVGSSKSVVITCGSQAFNSCLYYRKSRLIFQSNCNYSMFAQVYGGDFQLDSSEFFNMTSYTSLFSFNATTVTINSSNFTQNSGGGLGSLLQFSNSYVNISNSYFIGNTGSGNGVVSFYADEDSNSLFMTGVQATNNFVPQQGGFLYVTGPSSKPVVQIEFSTFQNNTSGYNFYAGGAIFIYQSNFLSLKNVSFNGNYCSGRGGAVVAWDLLVDSQFIGNSAGNYAGAMHLVGVPSTMFENVWFSHNNASSGSAIYVEASSLNMSHCQIRNNTGTAVYTSPQSVAIFDHVIITQNDNGFNCSQAQITWTQSSIWGNIIKDFSACLACNWTGLDSPCDNACQRDACSICRGNDTCVGCDGVPFSEASNDTCACLKNDSCGTTFSTSSTSGSTGTSTSTTGSLVDGNVTTSSQYISSSNSQKKIEILAIAIGVPVVVVILVVIVIIIGLKKRKSKNFQEIELYTKPTTVKKLKDISVYERLGGGQFSTVYKGTWMGTTEVALKQLKRPEDFAEFVKEANILVNLTHKNVLQFYGVYTSPEREQYIVTEYLNKGSLRDFLLQESRDIAPQDLLSFCLDVASGMAYLADSNIVHADLAARNVLVTTGDSGKSSKYLAKIGDLGLGKVVQEGNSYYTSATKSIPVKWAAPEVVEFGKYSELSDVWSFGIVVWEIYSLGKTPYATLNNTEAFEQVTKGHRLPQPENCPSEIYKLMMECWNIDANKRPHFKQIYTKLSSLLYAKNTTSYNQAKDLKDNVYN